MAWDVAQYLCLTQILSKMDFVRRINYRSHLKIFQWLTQKLPGVAKHLVNFGSQ